MIADELAPDDFDQTLSFQPRPPHRQAIKTIPDEPDWPEDEAMSPVPQPAITDRPDSGRQIQTATAPSSAPGSVPEVHRRNIWHLAAGQVRTRLGPFTLPDRFQKGRVRSGGVLRCFPAC